MINYEKTLEQYRSHKTKIPDFIKEELFHYLPKTYDELIDKILIHYPAGIVIQKKDYSSHQMLCPNCRKIVPLDDLKKYDLHCSICGYKSAFRWTSEVSFEYIMFSSDSRLVEPSFFKIKLIYNLGNDSINFDIYELSHSKGKLDDFIKKNSLWVISCDIPDLYVENFKKQYPYSGFENFSTLYRKNYWLFYSLLYLKYPYIELLVKTRYLNIIQQLVTKYSPKIENDFVKNFNDGKNPKEILVVPEWIIPESCKIETINELRIIYNKYNPTKEYYEVFTQFHFSVSETRIFKQILAMKYKGKNLYTFDKLVSYIGRCDMYQAINPAEMLVYLRDYLKMSIESEVMPDLNSNSLKREHDIASRNYRLIIDEITEKHFLENAKKLNTYIYENSNFKVMVPETPQDLINEGKNNRNCVGSYVSSFAEGRSKIFFIRYKDKPEESYVTLEMRGPQVTQAYLASNRPISDKKTLEFIEKWQNHLKSKKIIA